MVTGNNDVLIQAAERRKRELMLVMRKAPRQALAARRRIAAFSRFQEAARADARARAEQQDVKKEEIRS